MQSPEQNEYLEMVLFGRKEEEDEPAPSITTGTMNTSRVVKRKRRNQTIVHKSVATDGYKWPYYDSYMPKLGMNDVDLKVVRHGMKR